jgi:hypothetical protein
MASYHEEQERKRRAEELRLQEIARKQEEDARLQEAEAAEKDGMHEEANAILDAPVVLPKVVVPVATPKISGVAFRETWAAEVVNAELLFKAVMEKKVPMSAISINLTFLNQQARSLKAEMNYPGVRTFAVKNVAAGRG